MIKRNFVRNVSTSSLATLISLGIAFFFTPYLIGKLGQEGFGLWSLILAIVAFMEIADLGMRQSFLRFVSKYYALDDWSRVNRVFSSTVSLYFGIGLVVEAATVVIACCFLDTFQIPSEQLNLARAVLLVIGTNQAISFFLIPFSSLGPYHRFDINNMANIGGKLLQTVAMVFLLESGHGLLQLAFALLVVGTSQRLLTNRMRMKRFPKVRFSIQSICRETINELVHYALYSFLIVVATLILLQVGNIIAGQFLSLQAVALFSVAAAIVGQLKGLFQCVAVPLVPVISHIDTISTNSFITGAYLKISKYLYFFSGFLASMIIVFGDPFILLWLGPSFEQSYDLLAVMIIPACIYFPQLTATSVLYGTSKHRLTLYVLVFEAITVIVLAMILVQSWGLYGITLGIALPQMIIYTCIYPMLFHRAMNVPVRPFFSTAGRSILLSVLFTLPVASAVIRILEPVTWLPLIMGALVTSVISLAGFLRFVCPSRDRSAILSRFKSSSG